MDYMNNKDHTDYMNFLNHMDYTDHMVYTGRPSYKGNTKKNKELRPEDILRKVNITFYSIILVLGIIGNGLVIWIAGFRMKKTISAVWFLNLAIADFLCCASLPLRIWVVYLPPSFSAVCKWSVILINLNMSTSVFILMAMSIDRCVSVMWPFWAKVHRTCKRVRITAAIIWVVSLIWTGVLLFTSYEAYLQFFSQWCSDLLFHRYWFIYKSSKSLLIRLVIMFVIPFLIISISYFCIFLKLKKSKRPQRSQRPYRIITAVILCFFICWFPYYIWPLTLAMFESSDFLFLIVHNIINTLAYLNSCINPIIYVFMGQDFKHSFLRSIPFRLERALSERPDDQCDEQENCVSFRTTDV